MHKNVLIVEVLTASGLEEADRIDHYHTVLTTIADRFLPCRGSAEQPVETARRLFSWLWRRKPSRYRRGASYRLHEVLDHEEDPGTPVVGNCLGLTALYHCLLRQLGIRARIVSLGWAFGKGPHVLSLLETDAGPYDIEHIFPDGFGYRGHLAAPDRVVWPEEGLIADIYLSRGNEYFSAGNYRQAMAMYDASLHWNRGYEKAALNRAIVRDVLQDASVDAPADGIAPCPPVRNKDGG